MGGLNFVIETILLNPGLSFVVLYVGWIPGLGTYHDFLCSRTYIQNIKSTFLNKDIHPLHWNKGSRDQDLLQSEAQITVFECWLIKWIFEKVEFLVIFKNILLNLYRSSYTELTLFVIEKTTSGWWLAFLWRLFECSRGNNRGKVPATVVRSDLTGADDDLSIRRAIPKRRQSISKRN